jgi:aspartyl-tRNA(Asn)/glutamyl-tRNA(Gln) amidotransferase subunit C
MSDKISLLLEKAAKLSRIEMSEADLEDIAPKAEAIFAAFDKLSALDTTGLEPLYTFRDEIEMRDDDVIESISTEELFSLAPESDSGHYTVPRVIGGDDVF